MQPQVKEKLALLEAFCKEQQITLEASIDLFDKTPHIELNIHDDNGELIEYDIVGHTITYL